MLLAAVTLVLGKIEKPSQISGPMIVLYNLWFNGHRFSTQELTRRNFGESFMSRVHHLFSYALLLLGIVACSAGEKRSAASDRCDEGDGGITLPPGFCASVFADEVGVARHMVVTPTGDVYVALEDASRSSATTTHVRGENGRGGLIALRDTNADGRADIRARVADASHSGMALRIPWLYSSSVTSVLRYRLDSGSLAPIGAPDTIVTGFPDGGHSSRSLALDDSGNLFVNIGSDSNACYSSGRGLDPCPELDARAGIWRYDPTRLHQVHDVSHRFATGIRNAVGLAWNQGLHALYATQHGRDDLHNSYPKLYSAEKSNDTPSEELLKVEAGDDYGWPYCYHDRVLRRRVLAPEYGGDGNKADRCADKKLPVFAFPGHWAPDGLLFYQGTQFPARYQDGVFITFHGSWNRSGRQDGYKVVFLPFAGGAPGDTSGTFANGFAGRRMDPGRAQYRPVGLAEGPDGSLYISDDQRGRIWRIIYIGKK
ncbi:MAG TPA: PQQ-dependent sugar dehydrogenase [Gemmatimonadaceae bacterium]|nr:PQQ-dependent sugar dehydrogenase [Gemmatimonadaceae bacterium]